ncbi:MAG: D-alanyl-D-alanine carboxypeptidase family protein [Beijerinckiaceae bacterium]|nr:D-alanyl-D-alanine carboxypeptidase family protein [Beijerinckiaceae bacterium]
MPAYFFALFRLVAIGLMLGVPLGAGASAQAPFQTSVQNAILMDAESRSVLFEKNADQLTSPASLAKIMTAELVFRELKEGRLSLDSTFVVSENAWRRGGAPSGGSAMFAALRSTIRVEDLLRGLIIHSGNDAAIVLAEGLGGTEEVFATMMTRRARELGFDKMTFRNAWGKSDPEQKVTTRQMALLAEHVIRTYPEYYHFFGEKEFTWNKIRQVNRNPLLAMDIGADGMKTGNIDESGYALVGSAVADGQRLILVINGAKTARERADEARKLLTWGLRTFEPKVLFEKGAEVGSAQVYGGVKSSVSLVADRQLKLLTPRGSSERLTGQIVYVGPVKAPVEEGSQIGKVRILRGKTLVLEADLVAGERVEQGTLTQRATDAGWELGVGVVRTYILKK